VWLALSRLGAIPLHVNTRYRLSELSSWAKTAEAEVYVMPGIFKGYDYHQLAADLKRETPSLKLVLSAGEERDGALSLPKLLKQSPSPRLLKRLGEVKVNPYGVSHFLLSGGTTGLPKIIPRTHADYVYGAEMLGRLSMIVRNTRTLIVTPLTHNLGFVYSLATLFNGGRLTLTDETKAEGLMEIIQRERITFFVGVPTLFIRMLKSEVREKYDLTSLQIVLSSGQAMPESLALELERKLGCLFQNLYGVSEGFSLITRLDDPERVRTGTAGRPTSPFDEIRLVDPETERDVGVNVPGELWVKGPRVIRGYYKDPLKTMETFTTDGYYKSGDLLMLDEEGYFYYVSRLRDIINRGGQKIGAEEVEGYLVRHPNVKEAAVVGMPDPELGEKVCAYVTTKNGKPLTLEELRAFLERLGVAKYKWPEELKVVSEIPKTSLGKIDRVSLKAAAGSSS
jgi:non-ribosomal peptide synthetase component E (peptide arylation enzyme)